MTDDRPLQHISRVRKRAAPTRTAFDFIRVEILCPQCKKESLQPLAELEVSLDAICAYCGSVVDLSSHTWRAEISKLSQEYKEIKPV